MKEPVKTFYQPFLFVLFLLFFLIYIGFAFYAITELGVEKWGILGLGIGIGVFVKMLSDAWQFFFRKAPPTTEVK